MSENAKIYVRNNFQQTARTKELAEDIFTEEVLKDLTRRLTGAEKYEVSFIDSGGDHPFDSFSYNQGRLLYLIYKDTITIVTFTPRSVTSRNSPFQTLGSAVYAMFQLENRSEFSSYKKKLAYYFVHEKGTFDTDYAKFMFRVISTIGIKVLNPPSYVSTDAFVNVLELITAKNLIREKNKKNRSTNIILGAGSKIEIYAKTFGANKYESMLLALSCRSLIEAGRGIIVYEISDNSLTELPESVHEIFDWQQIPYDKSDVELRRDILQQDRNSVPNLRSPSFISDMLDIHGAKKCSWCSCAIPQLIEAAHIWPVGSIRRDDSITLEEKFFAANDANNGIWLCRNHHKLFDSDIVALNSDFKILKNVNFSEDCYVNYINETLCGDSLVLGIFSDRDIVRSYIELRNSDLDMIVFS
ncbi:HNH endonuclease [Rothia sp. L_38]|uniref:HNH endonuclease n=1 Tax=Rothia sp. L_38 TaxID=3422315 RepID=UPI003D6C309D